MTDSSPQSPAARPELTSSGRAAQFCVERTHMETLPPLTGTLPVRMHADRFYGTVQADGQHPRVAALACDEGDVVALALVGYETSVSAVFARLWMREAVHLLVAPEVVWRGPRLLRRKPITYRQFSIQLHGTRESHCFAVPLSAHIREGILHPPDLPKPEEEEDPQADGQDAKPTVLVQPTPAPKKPDRSRYVLGNWTEPTPNQRSFLGHLYAMRVLFLHRDDEHPEWAEQWAAELWSRGRSRSLITPLTYTLGVNAWKLSDDLQAWGQLAYQGTQEGWLPWRVTEEPLPTATTVFQTTPSHHLV